MLSSLFGIQVVCFHPHLGDVALDLGDSWQRSHGLQVHRHDLHLLCLLLSPSEWKNKRGDLKSCVLLLRDHREDVCRESICSFKTKKKKRQKKPEFATENLTPAARGGTQVHGSVHT